MIDRKVHSGFVRMPTEVNPDDIKSAVDEFLEENPVTPGASAEEVAQIQSNTEKIEEIQARSDSLDALVISESEPTIDDKCLWIQSGQYESFDIPQINDETVSEEDTWSSKKISDELSIQVGQLSEEIANIGSGSGASSLHITIDSDNVVHFTTSSTGTGDTDGGGSSDTGSTGGDSDVGVDGGVVLHCTDGSVISCGNALDELQYRYVFLISDTYYVYGSASQIEILQQSVDKYVVANTGDVIYRGSVTNGLLGSDFAVLEPTNNDYYGGYRTTDQLVYANADIYTTAGVLWASATV